MDSEGNPPLKVGDKITKAENRKSGKRVATWTDLQIIEWRHASWGFGSGRDLFIFYCEKQEQPS